MNWSSRSLGSRLQHGVFYLLVRLHAVWLARLLLRAVVFYYTLIPGVRSRCLPYLRRRFGETGRMETFRHAYRLYLCFGQTLLDRIIGGIRGVFPFAKLPAADREVLMDAVSHPRGCLLLSAHVGAWQLGMAWMESTGRPLHIVQHRDPGDVDKHYFEHGKGKPVDIINPADPSAFLDISTALRRGETVCLMGDRLFGAASGAEASVAVPFLGGEIRLPVTAYALANITGAALVLILVVVDEEGARPACVRRMKSPEGLDRRKPESFAPWARDFAACMEDVVREHPYQFFNFYDMWLN